MTQKEKVMQCCIEHLNSRGLGECFDYSAFNHIYIKRNGAQANAFLLALSAADYMILNAHNFINSKKLNNETPDNRV